MVTTYNVYRNNCFPDIFLLICFSSTVFVDDLSLGRDGVQCRTCIPFSKKRIFTCVDFLPNGVSLVGSSVKQSEQWQGRRLQINSTEYFLRCKNRYMFSRLNKKSMSKMVCSVMCNTFFNHFFFKLN